jgi:hypothetical protein
MIRMNMRMMQIMRIISDKSDKPDKSADISLIRKPDKSES